MPELPEVETIRRGLQQHVRGRTILRAEVRDTRLRWPVEKARLERDLIDREIIDIDRRAKYLLLQLSNNATLLIHLGMSGRLLLAENGEAFDKHDHVVFHLAGGGQLRFRDPRRFGMVDLVEHEALATYPQLVHLGVEPLDEQITAATLYALVAKSKKPIKNLLMDNGFIVGVGNIYANEALHRAGIHPLLPANRLDAPAWQGLFAAVRHVLRDAIAQGGTTLNDFVDSSGSPGYFQLSLAVYGRTGEPCPRCGTAIAREVLAGRSSFFCPGCQPQS